ncbi:MAG: phage head closure protein [Rhizobiaceae bacterium]|nr:phage head closure protein [Rhizobiaceae bacterium]
MELALEACTPMPDGIGGHTEAWTLVATLFARVEPISATGQPGADQTIETLTHRITIRHRAGVVAGMRFRREARVFAIVSVHDPDEGGRYLVCRTREVTT